MHTNHARFSLQLPSDLAERLRADAREHERSVGAEVRWILREHQAREKAFDVGFGAVAFTDDGEDR